MSIEYLQETLQKHSSKMRKENCPTSRFIRPPSPVLTTSVNLSSEVKHFRRRQVPQPVALPRCYTKVLVNRVSVYRRGGHTRLRRLDLLDLLLLDPMPPAVY